MVKNEFSIMPTFNLICKHKGQEYLVVCSNERSSKYSHRHEIFFGNAYRKKSIEYGLVVFLESKYHNASELGVHFVDNFNRQLKAMAQVQCMNYYNWTKEKFIMEFGRNYLD